MMFKLEYFRDGAKVEVANVARLTIEEACDFGRLGLIRLDADMARVLDDDNDYEFERLKRNRTAPDISGES